MVAKSDEQTGGFAAYVRDDMRIENRSKLIELTVRRFRTAARFGLESAVVSLFRLHLNLLRLITHPNQG